jgi:zinc transporter ZupT
MSLCENTGASASAEQVLLAFGLTTLAGLATTLGALVPIFVSHTKPKYLASALSFAAGNPTPIFMKANSLQSDLVRVAC